jgi:hypothetical protein
MRDRQSRQRLGFPAGERIQVHPLVGSADRGELSVRRDRTAEERVALGRQRPRLPSGHVENVEAHPLPGLGRRENDLLPAGRKSALMGSIPSVASVRGSPTLVGSRTILGASLPVNVVREIAHAPSGENASVDPPPRRIAGEPSVLRRYDE